MQTNQNAQQALIETRQNKKKTNKRKAGLDEMAHDEYMAHMQNLGRWSRDAFKGLSCVEFITTVEISTKARQPLDHALHFLQKKREPNTPTSLARMVFGKAARISGALTDNLTLDRWEDILDKVPVSQILVVKKVIITLTLAYLGDFTRRFMTRVRS